MKRALFIVLILATGCCKLIKNKKPEIIPEKPASEIPKGNEPDEEEIRSQLEKYFDSYRLIPAIEINNIQSDQTEIQLANHHIKWFDSENGTKIRIDNETISFKDCITLNNVWWEPDSVDFVNNWDQIRLFKYKSRELIGIRMLFDPCTGNGCSVNYFLVYDAATKSKNFFGTFRTDNELELFDFRNDQKIDYVSKTFIGDNYEGPKTFRYELYSLNSYGKFLPQKDETGICQIDLITYYGHSGYPELTHHWINNPIQQ